MYITASATWAGVGPSGVDGFTSLSLSSSAPSFFSSSAPSFFSSAASSPSFFSSASSPSFFSSCLSSLDGVVACSSSALSPSSAAAVQLNHQQKNNNQLLILFHLRQCRQAQRQPMVPAMVQPALVQRIEHHATLQPKLVNVLKKRIYFVFLVNHTAERANNSMTTVKPCNNAEDGAGCVNTASNNVFTIGSDSTINNKH